MSRKEQVFTDNHWMCYSASELYPSLLTLALMSRALQQATLEISFTAKVTYKNDLHLN